MGYYAKTKQRVRVVFDDGFMRETEEAIAHAWQVAAAGIIPPPLEDSPKCGGCSLVGICLPDETSALRWSAGSTDGAEQLALFEAEEHPALTELRKLDVTTMTPVEALTRLYELQRRAAGK